MARSKKAFLIVLFFTVIALFSKAFYSDMQVKKLEDQIAFEESKALANFTFAFREHYQETFLKFKIPVDEQTLHLLPAVSISNISEKFTKKESEKSVLRTVSQSPRNPNNTPNLQEQEAIKFFENNKEQNTFFKKLDDNTHFYATPLRIGQNCLKCHGKKEDAIISISQKYEHGYDYKLNDLKGIMSIQLEKQKISNALEEEMKKELFVLTSASLLFLIVIYNLFKIIRKKEDKYTQTLEEEVNKKTIILQEREKELYKQVYFDVKTNLPNRNSLLSRLEENPDKKVLIALLNIDNFSHVNDFYGYSVGDRVIISYAQFIQDFLKNYDKCKLSLYKMHADEFCIVCADKNMPEYFTKLISELIKTSALYCINEEGNEIYINITAGIGNYIADADMALRKAKKEKKNYIVYNESFLIQNEYKENMQMSKKLNKALERKAVVPYFQPIFNVKNKAIEKYEVLARLIEEDGTVIAPFHFIEIAKKTKQYEKITKTIIAQSFDYFREKPFIFSVNISMLDILNPSTQHYMLEQIKKFPEPNRIMFEILETEEVENFEIVSAFIKTIKKLGCSISVDDFGTGYSNLEHLIKLDVDLIKIDGSLIKNIDTDQKSEIIVKLIINFATLSGKETCAEFVHSKEVFYKCVSLGTTFVQGYYIGEPKEKIENSTLYI
ncbi:MAG: EAL domain-containing protein [Sulfurospirillaceae bacterium]|nr:EAL domain-containing protein [Sulfurospirillaceae bacterium]